jgi:uncharacterized OsmC-like protein
MPVKVTLIEGLKFKAEYDGVEIVSGTKKRGGSYAGMSPGALMASALGLCTGMCVAAYLDEEDIEHGGLEITISNKYDRDPLRVVQFVLDINLKAELEDEYINGLLEEANRCYVGNTIRGGPEIKVNLRTGYI